MINQPNETAKRARVASVVLIGLFLYLGSAFFRTQILQYKKYALQSEQNRLRVVPLAAPRGFILDRNGKIIAENLPGFTVSLLATSLDSLRLALDRFDELVPIDSTLKRRLGNPKKFDPDRPVLVLSNATFEQVSLLEEHKLVYFPSLVVQAAPKRSYPDRKAVASFVGYTRSVSDEQLALEKYKDYKAGQQVGITGLEEQYEHILAGREGRQFSEQNARLEIVRPEGVRPTEPAQQGDDLPTNIDLDLQRFIVDSVFGDKLVGGAFVMNPENGEVLAMHSGPSFDPNDFIGGISQSKLDSINRDPRNIMYSKVIKGKYAPASTFKLATAILALQHNLIGLNDRMPQACHGSIMIGNRPFRCWKEGGHGDVTLAQAIEGSCNVYFYQLGQRLGLARLMAGGVQLGFADKSGIDLPGELAGTFPASIDYFNQKYGRGGWTEPSQIAFVSIGQGVLDETVANVARFYSALATNGYAATPQLIRGQPPVRKQIYQLTPAQNQGVRDALTNVVSTGTAAGSRRSEIAIAGKTGTAQNSQGPAHGWFVGFAPADKPTLLIAILIEHGLHGSDAARYASKIFGFHFKQEVAPVVVTGG